MDNEHPPAEGCHLCVAKRGERSIELGGGLRECSTTADVAKVDCKRTALSRKLSEGIHHRCGEWGWEGEGEE